MCSELFRIPYTWGGVPIFGVGVLLAIWAIVAAFTLFGLIRQNGWSNDILSSVPVLLLLGAAILFLPRVFPDGLPIRGYGVMLLVGITSGVGLAMHRARQGGLDPEIIISLAIWMVVCGIIGARLFYVIEYWHESFADKKTLRDTILQIANIPEGGLVIFGGFIGAMVGFVTLIRKQRLPLLAMADLIAPSMAIGLAFGRIGCFLNGCCYGGQTALPWHVSFPEFSSRYESKANDAQRYSPPYVDQASHGEMHGFRLDPVGFDAAVVTRVDAGTPAAAAGLKENDVVDAINDSRIASIGDAKGQLFDLFLSQQPLHLTLRSGKSVDIAAVAPPTRSLPVHPAQLYSAIDAGLLGWLLWAWYPFRRRDGELIALLLTVHPITRFMLEIIRTDEPTRFGTGMTISQNISLALLACGVGIWWYLSRRPRGIVWPLAVPHPAVGVRTQGKQPARA